MRLENVIRLPVYRIFASFAVGVFVYFINRDSVINIIEDFSLTEKELLSLWYLTVPVFCIIGEVFCMVGEMIINPLFDYQPFHKTEELNAQNIQNSKIEKVNPCSDKYITYTSFGHENAMEISEIHFVLSRMFAGLMAVAMSYIEIILPFVIGLIFSLFQSLTKSSFYKCCVTFLTINTLLLGIVSINTFWILFKNDFTKNSYILIIIAFFYISSVYYRAHANKLIYFNKKGGI